MQNDTPVARSSLVPVLGCIALILFGLNFYRFVDLELLSKWRPCDRHVVVHEHVVRATPQVQLFTFDRQLEAQERALRRSLERAEVALARARHQTGIRNLEPNLERLQAELEAKQENLELLHATLELRHERLADHQCEEEHADGDHRFQIQIIR